MTVGRAHTAPLACSRLVAICHPVARVLEYLFVLRFRTVKAHAHHNHRFGVDFTAEAYELIRAEAVLVVVHPHPVRPALPLLLRAYAPFPVVLGHISSSRPAQTGRVQILYRLENIRPESAQLASFLRGKAHLIHLHAAVAYGNCKLRISLIITRVQAELVFFPLFSLLAQVTVCHPFASAEQTYPQGTFSLGVDITREPVPLTHNLRSLLYARELATGADTLGIVHIDCISLHQGKVPVAECHPLGSN